MVETDFRYLEPVALDFDRSDPTSFERSLRRQMRERLREQGIEEKIKRAVYVIRMKGSFLIAYKEGNSPVLYIGRGNANGRIHGHIGKWIKHVGNFGNDTRVEVRILIPRRRSYAEFYKYVEADLLSNFREKYGSLPYFNGRLENAFSNSVEYSASQTKRMKTLIGVGSGNKPWWALKPTRANPTRGNYLQGEVL